jgi:hypothetical protein
VAPQRVRARAMRRKRILRKEHDGILSRIIRASWVYTLAGEIEQTITFDAVPTVLRKFSSLLLPKLLWETMAMVIMTMIIDFIAITMMMPFPRLPTRTKHFSV